MVFVFIFEHRSEINFTIIWTNVVLPLSWAFDGL